MQCDLCPEVPPQVRPSGEANVRQQTLHAGTYLSYRGRGNRAKHLCRYNLSYLDIPLFQQ